MIHHNVTKGVKKAVADGFSGVTWVSQEQFQESRCVLLLGQSKRRRTKDGSQ